MRNVDMLLLIPSVNAPRCIVLSSRALSEGTGDSAYTDKGSDTRKETKSIGMDTGRIDTVLLGIDTSNVFGKYFFFS